MKDKYEIDSSATIEAIQYSAPGTEESIIDWVANGNFHDWNDRGNRSAPCGAGFVFNDKLFVIDTAPLEFRLPCSYKVVPLNSYLIRGQFDGITIVDSKQFESQYEPLKYLWVPKKWDTGTYGSELFNESLQPIEEDEK
jgi:hypothetical protein